MRFFILFLIRWSRKNRKISRVNSPKNEMILAAHRKEYINSFFKNHERDDSGKVILDHSEISDTIFFKLRIYEGVHYIVRQKMDQMNLNKYKEEFEFYSDLYNSLGEKIDPAEAYIEARKKGEIEKQQLIKSYEYKNKPAVNIKAA